MVSLDWSRTDWRDKKFFRMAVKLRAVWLDGLNSREDKREGQRTEARLDGEE
jgi:hypothetical protein